ncbi:MAG: metal ABC transporter permease [Planctomycetota bacterium]
MSAELWALAIAVVTAISCALCGSLLVVNRQSMVSEALSHAVLPGLALAFFLLRDYNSPWLLISAAAGGMLMIWLTELLRSTRVVDSDASLGIVFAGMFSLGILFVTNLLRNTHFHADCVLEGNLVLAPFDRLRWSKVDLGPRDWWLMSGIVAVQLVFILACYKELKAMLFDPQLAGRFGLRPKLVEMIWLSVVSLTTVAAFNVAGSILIVGLMIAPPAAAFLLTQRLSDLLIVAVALAVLSAIAGFLVSLPMEIAPTGPVASCAGLVFLLVYLFAPKTGLVSQHFQRKRKRADTVECLVLQLVADNTSLDQLTKNWNSVLSNLIDKELLVQANDKVLLTSFGQSKLDAMLAEL